MINDTERREVARRLREVNPYRNYSYTIPYHRYTPAVEYLAELVGALGYSPKNDVSRLEFQNRLADLIEPEPERTCCVDFDEEVGCWRCSECGWELTPGGEQFCPMCGARVIQEVREDSNGY